MEHTNQWWAYLHVNGDIMPKRYFDDADLHDAVTSPFVQRVVGPFPAKDRSEAMRIATQKMGEQA